MISANVHEGSITTDEPATVTIYENGNKTLKIIAYVVEELGADYEYYPQVKFRIETYTDGK